MSSFVFSGMVEGAEGKIIRVESQIARGLPYFIIVGLGDSAVIEARERVKTAMQVSGFEFPRMRKVVNLSPAHLKKHGTQFDLAIAVSLLRESKQIIARDILDSSVFIGELSLDGSIRGTRGTIAIVEAAKKAGFKNIFIGTDRASEALLVPDIRVFAPKNLQELVAHLKGIKILKDAVAIGLKPCKKEFSKITKGHSVVKRAVQIAALFRHHLVLIGPPGAGKSLMARSIEAMTPALTGKEIPEVVKIYSAFTDENFSSGKIYRPFREVSSTVSLSAFTGGGGHAGEMSLAHKGFLLLDDFHNFSRAHIEAILKPMEERHIFVNSGRKKTSLPSDFMLIATMNPCPCGEKSILSDSKCKCKEWEVTRYLGKFPQAFWDRVEMVVEIDGRWQVADGRAEDGRDVSEGKIQEVIERQQRRLKDFDVSFNGEMPDVAIAQTCKLDERGEEILFKALKMKMISGRGYFNAIRLARSIADVEGHESIQPADIAEALGYRKK
ncbi:MAG: hypothetical protein ACD_51C00025G0004 [uncultured bacterium]|nr:MAG: hypothetical protein ACD_51C00025G0004 [uncultured bacterium]OGJ48287.1 MAG: hypothetical protein A2244_02105 [Candidatus Peregrinibacteria bacterium RIFOXYA2_FULL_41_18]